MQVVLLVRIVLHRVLVADLAEHEALSDRAALAVRVLKTTGATVGIFGTGPHLAHLIQVLLRYNLKCLIVIGFSRVKVVMKICIKRVLLVLFVPSLGRVDRSLDKR